MAQEKKQAEGSNHIKTANTGNELITLKEVPQLLPTTSINFPSPKAAIKRKRNKLNTLNQWKSSKDIDLSYISTSITQDHFNFRKKVAFLTTNYDPNLDGDKEENDIKKSDFAFTRSVLTISDLEKVLIESPPIVHISTHGDHKYKDTNDKNAFQIALEEPQTLRYLIDEHPKFSAYYAVIAILFEMEISHFVQYGFDAQWHKKVNVKPYKTWIWKDQKNALLCDEKIFAMFQTILDCYGCVYKENTKKRCVEIFWGTYKTKENSNNELTFVSAPYQPLPMCTFTALYSDDTTVISILKSVIYDYNQSLKWNAEILRSKSVQKYQKFSWAILYVLLQRTMGDSISLGIAATAEFTDESLDLTQSVVMDDMDGLTADECAAFFGFNENELTQNKFADNQRLTREILIDVTSKKWKAAAKKDAIKMKKLSKKLSAVREEIMFFLHQKPDIRIRWDIASKTSANVHIIRFADVYGLAEAHKQIDLLCRQRKYHSYDIKFRKISKATELTKKEVGFISGTQEKIYSINIKNKTDEISSMVKEHLGKECKIKLLILNGCHSFILGKIFSEFVENVICVHPFVKIWDSTATTFTSYFYQFLPQYLNPRIPFSHSVLKAYNVAKANVAKECSNDFACASHSHSHPISNFHSQYIKQIKMKFNELHLNENWKVLQNHINDEKSFQTFREDMSKSGALMQEPMHDLHDGKTLIVSNISEREMNELREYLEECNAINEDQKDDSDFVQHTVYHKNKYYLELSVAYFKFQSKNDRDSAKKILSQKTYEQELLLSEKILLKSHMQSDEKEEFKDFETNAVEMELWQNLGWIHRVVPRCCCSPHHPHIVQDKLILLQKGYIINRSIINNISQIKAGLDKLRVNKLLRKKSRPKSRVVNYESSDEKKQEFIVKKRNNFGNNQFKSVPKRTMNSFGVSHRKSFGVSQRKKINSFNNFDEKSKPQTNERQKQKQNSFGNSDDQYFDNSKFDKKPTKSINIFEDESELTIQRNECRFNFENMSMKNVNEFTEKTESELALTNEASNSSESDIFLLSSDTSISNDVQLDL